MNELLYSIEVEKMRLDRLRLLTPRALSNLNHYYDLDLTYTSNALDGNSLSDVETTLVVEKGLTIPGKPLIDHQNVLDHFDAIRFTRELARRRTPLAEADVQAIHRLVTLRSAPDTAGHYAAGPRSVETTRGHKEFPAAAEIPALMGAFAGWLKGAANTPESAVAVHRRFVGISPFAEGNGRTARLLMNLILLRGGYPAVPIRPGDRQEYMQSLDEPKGFEPLFYQRLADTVHDYVTVLEEALPPDQRT